MSTQRWSIPTRTTAGFGLAFALFLASGLSGVYEQTQAIEASNRATQTLTVLDQIERIAGQLVDAEAGQRGYLLTSDRGYLEPYERATRTLDADLEQLRAFIDADPAQRDRTAALGPLLAKRLDEIRLTLERHQRGGTAAPLGLVESDLGKRTMGHIHAVLAEINDHERELLRQRRVVRIARAARTRVWMILSTLLGAALAAATLFSLNWQTQRRAAAERAAREQRRLAELEHEQIARAEAAQSVAAAANHAKDEFLAVLSHELRSPLQAMLGWMSILKSGIAKGRSVDRAVESIERSVQLQVKLVNDLLDVSRIIAGKLALDPEQIDVALVVETAVESARPAADAKGLTLASSIAALPDLLFADERRIRQVVGNLLTNAIKFTPSGGQVSVTLTREDGEVILKVADTGAGIAPGFLPHVFDRFQQADVSTTRAHGGLGLGLAIVKTLAELHGGRVEAESEGLGRGATFTVRLPLKAAPALLPAAGGERALREDLLVNRGQLTGDSRAGTVEETSGSVGFDEEREGVAQRPPSARSSPAGPGGMAQVGDQQ